MNSAGSNPIRKSHLDFKTLLQEELTGRCRKNPKYSLRSFARSLGIGSSVLSDMLNGKRTITPASVERLGLALGIPLDQIERLKRRQATVSGRRKPLPTRKDQKVQLLTLDSFHFISDWYHYAILELLKVESFEPDAAWVARALSITRSEVNVALERMQRLGILRVDPVTRKWTDLSDGYTSNIHGDLTSAGARMLQRQILEQSIAALQSLPTSVRNHTSMTLAIDRSQLPRAVELIRDFRRGLANLLEEAKPATDVYQLSISLFPVTRSAVPKE